MPPVTNTETPTLDANSIVALTVVAPVAFAATHAAMSRRDTLAALGPNSASFARSASGGRREGRLRRSRSSPASRRARGRSLPPPIAIARFSGYGIPCETIVDSSATTARPSASASATSGETTTPPVEMAHDDGEARASTPSGSSSSSFELVANRIVRGGGRPRPSAIERAMRRRRRGRGGEVVRERRDATRRSRRALHIARRRREWPAAAHHLKSLPSCLRVLIVQLQSFFNHPRFQHLLASPFN